MIGCVVFKPIDSRKVNEAFADEQAHSTFSDSSHTKVTEESAQSSNDAEIGTGAK